MVAPIYVEIVNAGQAAIIWEYLLKEGYRWGGGHALSKWYFWDVDRTQSITLSLEENKFLGHCSRSWYENEGCTVITFEQFSEQIQDTSLPLLPIPQTWPW